MTKTILTLAFFLSIVLPVSATELSDLAESMAPGTWAELNTTNFTANGAYGGGAPSTNGTDYIVNFGDDAVWDTAANELLFLGAGHGGPRGFMKYSAATNAWSKMQIPPFHISHTYQNNALDQENRILYHNPGNTAQVYPYDIATGTWGPSLPSFSSSKKLFGSAMDFFPELGGLVHFAKNRLDLFNISTNRWSSLSNSTDAGNYHVVAQYNPVHKVMLIGGGERFTNTPSRNERKRLYRLDASGDLTLLGLAPFNVGTAESAMAIDPVSGDYLIAGKDGAFYSFDIVNDIWTDLGTVPWPWHNNKGRNFAIGSGIWNEGVAMFAWAARAATPNLGTSGVFLYKTTAIPEPSTGLLGLMGVGLLSRRRRR